MIDEKKDEFKLPDNMKFWCRNKECATKVQEKLFEMGYKWGCTDKPHVWHPNGRDGYTIYADKEQLMSWGDIYDYEREDDYPKYRFIETTGEIAPVNKETQEGSSIDVDESTNKTESLDALFNQIVLLQKENDSLVEQKEQLVDKISANTQAINILKDKMQGRLNQVGIVSVGDDKANVVEEGGILDITDWQDLKVGDMVEITSVHKGTFSSGYEKFIGTAATVLRVEDIKYQNLEVMALNTRL